LAGSRSDLDGNPAGIAARFWPPGFFLSAGISVGSQQDSRREAKFPAAKISPGSKNLGGQNLAGTCRESRRDSRREARIAAAKISPGSYRESRRSSRREATSRRPKSRRDVSANLGKILGGQNKSAILTGISTIFCGGKQNSWRDSSRQNFSQTASNDFGDINRLLNKLKG